jgi:uncharacterized protein YdhG (YjbR/CyaY superfamily)
MNTDFIPKTIDEYIKGYPDDIQEKLIEMRKAIRKAAPDAEEKISYRMPAFTLKGMLVYFAAHTNHIGFYPLASAIKAFGNQLGSYNTSKGGIQFPYKDPLPLNLIGRIVEFRVKENFFKAEAKALKKRTSSKEH